MSVSLKTIRQKGGNVQQVIANRLSKFDSKNKSHGLGTLAAKDARNKGH